MSTNPEQPQAKPDPEHDFDELSGVYGFFRRHQKLLLYTAGLFTLLTFSITASLRGLVSSWFQDERDRGSITVSGQQVKLQLDDFRYGDLLARNYQAGVPVGVMPCNRFLQLRSGEGGDGELGEVFAILRRAAIVEGIEPSMVEVDRAIEAERERNSAESVAKLALARGFASFAEYRLLVAEAMRIGTMMRLQMLALDDSDAEAMRQLLLHKEKVAFRVATFDVKKYQEELAASTELTDEELEAWLDEQPQPSKTRMGIYDLPRAKLRIVALKFAEGQFDPSQWEDSSLSDFTASEDQLRGAYDADKERFKVAGKEDEYRPFEDESVQAELTRVLQAEQVMNDLLKQLRDAQTKAVEPFTKKTQETQNDLASARTRVSELTSEKKQKEAELAAKEGELAKDPENAELQAAVDALKQEIARIADDLTTAENALKAVESALEADKEAENEARVAFDLNAECQKLVEGKSGFAFIVIDEMLDAEDLEDLEAHAEGLGKWPQATAATSLRIPGAICFQPGRTSTASILFQATAVDLQPLKPREEYLPLVKDAYWVQKADAAGREKRDAMDKALLRLAKEKIPEFVKEREESREQRLADKIKEWEDGLTADIQRANEMLATPGLGTKARQAWETMRTQKQKQLDAKEARVKMFERVVDDEIKAEIRDEARKHFGEVLEAAAAEAGFTVAAIGPYPRSLNRRPRFDKAYDPTTVFVFRTYAEMDAGEANGPLYDSTERRYHVLVCDKVEPLEPEDVLRREFVQMRESFSRLQVYNALSQAFTLSALEKRYQRSSPVGVQDEVATR